MPKFANKVELRLYRDNTAEPGSRDRHSLKIDGKEFPYYITEEGLTLSGLADGTPPRLTFSMEVMELVVHDDRFKQE